MHHPRQFRISPVMIGRDDALTHLTRSIEGLASQRSDAVFIVGEPGIGKSRLVGELKLQFADFYSEGVILAGHAFDTDRSLPFAPLSDMLRSSLGEVPLEQLPELLAPFASELVKIVPELAAIVPDVSISASLGGAQERQRLLHSINQFFLSIAARHPMLVIFEDLHWSDDASLELIAHLSRRIEDVPLLLLLTYRDEEMQASLSHLRAILERERLASEIFLEPLTRTEIDIMLEEMLGERSPIHLDLRDELWSLTGGNPFFIEEIMRSYLPDDQSSHGAERSGLPPSKERRIPHSVNDAVQRRLTDISAAARQLAQAAAVAGRRFEFPLLKAITDDTDEGLLKTIRELVDVHLVVEESADRFAFRHALTREAIYGELLSRERRALHRSIVEALSKGSSKRTGARIPELAYHAFEAGMWNEALDYSRQMGEQAQSINDSRAAIEHYSRGLAAAEMLDVEPPVELYLARGRAYATAGKFDDALADQSAAGRLARRTRDTDAEWNALINLGMLWAERDYSRTGDFYRDAHALVREGTDSAKRAASLNALGNWQLNIERPAEALRCHQEALEIFLDLDDRIGSAGTLDLLGMANYLSGDLISGTETFRQAIPILEAERDKQGLASCLATLTMRGPTLQTNTMVVPCDTLDDCLNDGERALEMARLIGWRAGEAYALWLLGFVLGARGEPARALAAAQSALDIAEEIEHRQWMTASHCALGAIHLDLMNEQEARAHFHRALGLAGDINSLHWQRTSAGFLASTHVEEGDLERAKSVLDPFLGEDLTCQTLSQRLIWCAWSELSIAEDNAERALTKLDSVIASSPNSSGKPILRFSYLRGRALAVLGRSQEAIQEFDKALSLAQAHQSSGMDWRIRLELARLQLDSNELEASNAQFAAASDVLNSLAAKTNDERLAENLRKRFSARVPERRPQTALQQAKQQYDGLTARQREVATLVAHGESNRSIADRLSISERTVESHITNILSTLAFTSRTQIAAWAVEKGLMSDRSADLGN